MEPCATAAACPAPHHTSITSDVAQLDKALEHLRVQPETGLYFGLVHYDDVQGDAARLTAARRFARVGGVATEFGMARGDPVRLPALLARNRRLARRFGPSGFCRDVVDDRRRSWTGTDGSNPCSSSSE